MEFYVDVIFCLVFCVVFYYGVVFVGFEGFEVGCFVFVEFVLDVFEIE